MASGIEHLKRRIERVEACAPAPDNWKPSRTAVCLLDEEPPADAGVVIRVKTLETKIALQKGVSGGPILCPQEDRR
jgi:hypothetical protein